MRRWLLALLIALSAVVGAATLRATAQSVMTGPPATHPAAAGKTATDTPSGTAPAAPPGPIKDDPTVAPDKAGSADNNVSFPVDI